MNIKRIIKIGLVGFIFIALFATSELLYVINNPNITNYQILFLTTRITSFVGLHSISRNLLHKITLENIKERAIEYPSYITAENPFDNSSDQTFWKNYSKFVKKEKLGTKHEINPSNLAVFYYHIFLLDGPSEITKEAALKTSIILNPELSFFQVELANFYFHKNQLDRASDVIQFCLNFKFPKDHCIKFNEQYQATGLLNNRGFISDKIRYE